NHSCSTFILSGTRKSSVGEKSSLGGCANYKIFDHLFGPPAFLGRGPKKFGLDLRCPLPTNCKKKLFLSPCGERAYDKGLNRLRSLMRAPRARPLQRHPMDGLSFFPMRCPATWWMC